MVDVRYVDFGYKSTLSVKDLRQIKDEFFVLPEMVRSENIHLLQRQIASNVIFVSVWKDHFIYKSLLKIYYFHVHLNFFICLSFCFQAIWCSLADVNCLEDVWSDQVCKELKDLVENKLVTVVAKSENLLLNALSHNAVVMFFIDFNCIFE